MSGAILRLPAPAVSDRPSEVALDLALRLVVGARDPAVDAWLRHAMLRWIRSDGELPLSQCLHLGGSPRRVRLALRDRWLVDATRYVTGSPWARAKTLQREAHHFVRYRWPSWRKLDTLPLTAGSPVELCLHGAMLAEPHLPTTVEGWLRITNQVVGTP